MPCPCNFKNDKIVKTLYAKGLPSKPKKLQTRNQAIFKIKKLNTLKDQVNLKNTQGLQFKLLPRTIVFKVEDVDGKHKINLDSKEYYKENKVYYLTPGIYTLVGVPKQHSIKVSKDDKNLEMHSKESIKSDDGKEYYHGNVIMVVRGDFEPNGLECYYHGSMGRKDIFYYKV